MYDITAKQKALEYIINTDKEFLTPAEIAPVLGVDPHSIRITARQRPNLIKFEFTFVGNRMKIPKTPFLRFVGINADNLVGNPASVEMLQPNPQQKGHTTDCR